MGAFNETTRAEYQGRNIDRLVNAEILHGYDSRRGWAGYRQWLDAGRVVRKGEHGVSCLTVVTVDRDANGHGGTRKPRGFRVFHYDQTDAVEHPDQPAPAPVPDAVVYDLVAQNAAASRVKRELGRIGF